MIYLSASSCGPQHHRSSSLASSICSVKASCGAKELSPELTVLQDKLFQYNCNIGIDQNLWKITKVSHVSRKQDKINLAKTLNLQS